MNKSVETTEVTVRQERTNMGAAPARRQATVPQLAGCSRGITPTCSRHNLAQHELEWPDKVHTCRGAGGPEMGGEAVSHKCGGGRGRRSSPARGGRQGAHLQGGRERERGGVNELGWAAQVHASVGVAASP